MEFNIVVGSRNHNVVRGGGNTGGNSKAEGERRAEQAREVAATGRLARDREEAIAASLAKTGVCCRGRGRGRGTRAQLDS